MTNFTRNAIKAAFWKLLSEKSYAKITVKDVVTACGINRNTFYYHYDNVPSVAYECISGRLFEIMRRNADDSFETCLTGICRDLLENREQILNIYHSTERVRLENFVITMAGFATERYAESVLPDAQSEEWKYRTIYVKNALFGECIGWLNNSMHDDYEVLVKEFCRITEEILRPVP